MRDESSANLPLECKRMDELFAQVRVASFIALASALFTFAILAFFGISDGLMVWFGATLLTTTLRFLLYSQYRARTLEERCAESASWLSRHRLTGFTVGLSWGLLPLHPASCDQFLVQQITLLVPAFVMFAAASTYGAYLSHFLTFTSGVMVAFIASSAWVRGPDALAGILIYLVYFPVLAVMARRYSANLKNAIQAHHKVDMALRAVRASNEELSHSNAELAAQRVLLDQEEALARHVYAQLTDRAVRIPAGIHVWAQAMGSFSGDLIQIAAGPRGETYVFLGDFTGHGLPAALGAVPTSAIFSTMAAKGLPPGMIVEELNTKLVDLLPVGYFCCATLLVLDAQRDGMEFWSGGLPPMIVRHPDGTLDHIDPQGVPLGVVSGDTFDSDVKKLAIGPGDELCVYSDGLTEAENKAGEMWGAQRLDDLVRRTLTHPGPSRLELLQTEILDFIDQAPASDDFSVIMVDIVPAGRES